MKKEAGQRADSLSRFGAASGETSPDAVAWCGRPLSHVPKRALCLLLGTNLVSRSPSGRDAKHHFSV